MGAFLLFYFTHLLPTTNISEFLERSKTIATMSSIPDSGTDKTITAGSTAKEQDPQAEDASNSSGNELTSGSMPTAQQNPEEVFVICECGRKVTFPQAPASTVPPSVAPSLNLAAQPNTGLPKAGAIANLTSDPNQLGVDTVQPGTVPLDTLSTLLQNSNTSFNKNVDPHTSKDTMAANPLAIQGLSYAIMAQSANDTASQLVSSLLEGITGAPSLPIGGNTDTNSQPQSSDKVPNINLNALFGRNNPTSNFNALAAAPGLVSGTSLPANPVGVNASSARDLSALVRASAGASASQPSYPALGQELPQKFVATIPPPGRMLFYTFDELRDYCYRHAKEHGYEISIGASRRMTPRKRKASSQNPSDTESGSSSDTTQSSSKRTDSRDDFRYVYFNCSRRGKEAPRDLKRKSRPKGTGCMFKLYANRYGSLWRLTVKHAEHNHPPNFDPHTLYVARRLPPEYREDFNMLMRQNFKPKEILELLKTMHGDKSCFTIKSIYEEVKRYKNQMAANATKDPGQQQEQQQQG